MFYLPAGVRFVDSKGMKELENVMFVVAVWMIYYFDGFGKTLLSTQKNVRRKFAREKFVKTKFVRARKVCLKFWKSLFNLGKKFVQTNLSKQEKFARNNKVRVLHANFS